MSLFGFREVRTTAGIVAGVIEVLTFAVLAAYVLRPFPDALSSEPLTHHTTSDRLRRAITPGRW